MARTITHKFAMLAGACALSLALAPSAIAAGGGGGGGGGGHASTAPNASPSGAHPMVAPQDQGPQQTPSPSARDTRSHAPMTVANASQPQPTTGTRVQPNAQQAGRVDPPPPQ